ncbi:MAG: TetR/AcrR family transcriptional regulator [Nakamurella sp.]
MEIRRGYVSPVRDDAARRTERRILDAAEQLFLERGYPSTTIAMIAGAAGVSKQTVYNTCGSKAGLLKRLYDVRLVGDDEPIPFGQRPEVRAMAVLTDPRQLLTEYARLGGKLISRLGPLLLIITAGAAGGDPDLVQHQATTDAERLIGSTGVAGRLAALDALRPGISVEHARDVIWTLTGAPVWQQFTRGRGWSLDEFSGWLGGAMADLLLPDHE